MKTSKELQGILDSIKKYVEKHKGNVSFIGSFMAFKGKDFEVVDDRMFAYGLKDCLVIDLEEMTKMMKAEKEDFVNW